MTRAAASAPVGRDRPYAAGPLGRSHDILLVVWLALISADRVDFLGGSGPFALTPFLALTPVVLVSETLRLSTTGGRIHLSTGARRYLLVILGLLVVVMASVFASLDLPLSAKRAALLTFLVTTGFLVALAIADRPHRGEVLLRGAKAALAVALVFTLIQALTWLQGGTEPFRLGSMSVKLHASLYGGLIPRFSGPVNDQNRAGLLYLFCLFALLRWAPPGWRRRGWLVLVVVLLLGTLSRSAALAGLAMGVVWYLDRPDVRVSRSAALAGFAAIAVLLTWLLLDPAGRGEAASTLAPLSERLSLAEASARAHFAVFERGVEVGTSSLKRAVMGVGYGNAHLMLQDFFPGNRYGNFHSLYVTMFAEAGAFALLLIVVVLAYPLVKEGPFRPLVAGLVFLNVFYQVHADPLFWLILPLAWLAAGRATLGGRARPSVAPTRQHPLQPALLAGSGSGGG